VGLRFLQCNPRFARIGRCVVVCPVTELPAYLKRLDQGPPLHAVMQAIAEGDHWLLAWNRQTAVIYRLLGKESGLGDERLRAIEAGSPATDAEITALAKAWKVDPAAVAGTLPSRPIDTGSWIMELDGELDAPLHLTFRSGEVFEHGMPVGSYTETPDGVRAAIGEDLVLLIVRQPGATLPVTMITKRDSGELVEAARLVRQTGAN